MRAATIGRLLGQLPPGAALMLGSRRVDDPTVPLADGDVLSMVTQTRARSTSST
jgi:hypothetical protein